MKSTFPSALRQITARKWSALGLSLALGAALVAVLFGALRPGAAAAAGLADPAVNYPCTPAGLNAALAAGGSATFACGAPTTIVVSARKNVPHNLSLDGTNTLVIQGEILTPTGLFTVPAGIHLSLLNLTLSHGEYGAINNLGVLNADHVQFISNTEYAVLNMPGSAATIANSNIQGGSSKYGQLTNGSGPTQTAALTVVNTSLHNNLAGNGAAILNEAGSVSINGSLFSENRSFQGGAIYNQANMSVVNSQFTFNIATQNVFDSLASSLVPQLGPSLPADDGLNTGGAIFNASTASLLVAGSSFSQNVAIQGGGAIMFGSVPLGSPLTPTGASLTIMGSIFESNCTSGPGGAVAASQKIVVNTSSFNLNSGETGPFSCLLVASNSSSAGGPDLASGVLFTLPANLSGAGGALFSSYDLRVDGSSFLSNSTAITSGGGGGAIENFTGGNLNVGHSSFTGNNAHNYSGGAIYSGFGTHTLVVGSDFLANQAQHLGGAIANFGVLTVSYSGFNANRHSTTSYGGGAIFSASDGGPLGPDRNGQAADAPAGLGQAPQGPLVTFLNVDHSAFISNTSGHEGGALDAGPAVVASSTFVSNTAPYGGAIDVWVGPFNLTGTTFIANAAVDKPLITAKEGGAIDTNGEIVTIVNSTFYKNRAEDTAAGGAIEVQGSSNTAISNSTFLSNTAAVPANGGAFAANAALSLHNVLLGFNVGAACQVSMTIQANDLEYPGSSCGAPALHLDPRALAPADNGGPTFTSALLPGSPAINAGSNSGCPATDQRGAARIGVCDIGAFEFGGIVARLWLPLSRR